MYLPLSLLRNSAGLISCPCPVVLDSGQNPKRKRGWGAVNSLMPKLITERKITKSESEPGGEARDSLDNWQGGGLWRWQLEWA